MNLTQKERQYLFAFALLFLVLISVAVWVSARNFGPVDFKSTAAGLAGALMVFFIFYWVDHRAEGYAKDAYQEVKFAETIMADIGGNVILIEPKTYRSNQSLEIDHVNQQIMESDALIVLVSHRATESAWLMSSVEFAFEHNKYIIVVYQGNLTKSAIWNYTSIAIKYSDDIHWKKVLEAKSLNKPAVIS